MPCTLLPSLDYHTTGCSPSPVPPLHPQNLPHPPQVKRWYMKANLVVHPDKVRQKGGGVEAVARADMVFDILKAAWGKFEAARAR